MLEVKKKKSDEEGGSVGSGEDGTVVGDSLSDEVTLEQKPEWSKEANHLADCGEKESILAEWTVGVEALESAWWTLIYEQYWRWF